MHGGFIGTNNGNNDPMLVNCYSNGNINGTYSGGIMGAHSWRRTGPAGTGINSYYLKSDTVNYSVGRRNADADELIESIGIEEVTQDIIDSLNTYIENDPDALGTTDWKKWALDKDGNPTFVD